MSGISRVTVLTATLTQSAGLTSGRQWRPRVRWALTLSCGHTGTRDAVYAQTGTKRGMSMRSAAEVADPPKHVRCAACERPASTKEGSR